MTTSARKSGVRREVTGAEVPRLLETNALGGYTPIITRLGFPTPFDVRDRYGVGALFPNKSKRTGVYLLVLTDGFFYIGLAKDVVRRFSQHRKHFAGRLIGLAFQQHPLNAIDEIESRLIRQGEKLGLPLEQSEWKSHVYGAADLDEIIDEAEYARWNADPATAFRADQWPPQKVEAGRRSRDDQNFRRLMSIADTDRLVASLRHYVMSCIPAAKRTAADYWNIACLPSTNRSSSPRLICLSAHVMELLVIGQNEDDPATVGGFFICARSTLESAYGSLRSAGRKLDVAIHTDRPYKSAGVDQCRVDFESLEAFDALLKTTAVRDAIAKLVHNVMRKGVNRYAQFHCSTLGERILYE